MHIELTKGDITLMQVEAIVNAANSSLMGGGGVDGAIHRRCGPAILEECMQIRSRQGGCRTGQAVITTGGNLSARFVIHTVGPVWAGGHHHEESLLADCYRNSLILAGAHGIRTIAFPNISTGVYGFPKELAVECATRAVISFPGLQQFETVFFVCFDDENHLLYKKKMPLTPPRPF